MSQQQQQQLVMLVIIITHPVLSTACLYAFSFSADRVVLAPFLIGTALARSLALFCIVRCGAMMMIMIKAGSHTSVHYCQLLLATTIDVLDPFGLRVRCIRRPVIIFVLLLLLLRAVRIDEADNDSVHVRESNVVHSYSYYWRTVGSVGTIG